MGHTDTKTDRGSMLSPVDGAPGRAPMGPCGQRRSLPPGRAGSGTHGFRPGGQSTDHGNAATGVLSFSIVFFPPGSPFFRLCAKLLFPLLGAQCFSQLLSNLRAAAPYTSQSPISPGAQNALCHRSCARPLAPSPSMPFASALPSAICWGCPPQGLCTACRPVRTPALHSGLLSGMPPAPSSLCVPTVPFSLTACPST